MLSTMCDVNSGAWDQIAPLLDEAMGELGEADRNAIVLRFFQNMTVPEVAALMQMNDAAVYKRVTRAVERLRRFYVKRGLALSAVVLGGAITANAVQAAPAGLAAGCITAAQGSTATPAVQSAVRATLQLMAWLKIKFALTLGLTLLVVGGLGTLAITQLRQKETPVPAAAVAAIPKDTGPAALVVAGLMPADAPEDVGTLAAETRRALLARGLAETRVVLLAGQVTRDRILEQLRTMERTGGDEFWLVLLGHSGRTQSGGPAFQVSGARLTAEDLKNALDRIPGRQFVFIGTGGSGGYLPLLQSPRRTVLSATRATGEPDQPRYLSAWVRAFAAAPDAPFATLAGRAAAAVDAFYTQANLGQSEHAQMTDPATGEIMDALKLATLAEKPAHD